MKRIEALADAVASLNSWQDPETDAYRLRNPGLLRTFTLRHPADELGRRIFTSMIDGYGALLFDLQTKCSGRSRSKLKKFSTIEELLVRGFSQPSNSLELVLCFLQKALPTEHVSKTTQLEYFVEEK